MPRRRLATISMTRAVAALALLASVATVAAACSSTSDRPGGAPTGGGGSTYVPPGGTGGGADGSTDGGSSGTLPDGALADGALPDGSLPDGAPLPALCSGVPREGAPVPELSIAAAPPAALGGAIPNGKYLLTKWEDYTGVGGGSGLTGESRRATLVVTGNAMQLAATDLESGAELPIVAETYTVTGSTLDTTEVCPLATRTRIRTFTSAAGELSLLESFGVTTRRLVYTKQ